MSCLKESSDGENDLKKYMKSLKEWENPETNDKLNNKEKKAKSETSEENAKKDESCNFRWLINFFIIKMSELNFFKIRVYGLSSEILNLEFSTSVIKSNYLCLLNNYI